MDLHMIMDNTPNVSVRANRSRSGLGMLSPLLLVLLLCGCASAPTRGDSEVYRYNPNLEYPELGAPWAYMSH
jgi:hypothetical protein